jgi:hypothetical protein
MTPTIRGRLQTRVFLSVTAGLIWTAIIAAALPRPAGLGTGSAYRIALEALGLMTAAGLLWEFLYHLLQQVRWDKDWPSIFALVTVLNEAVPLWFLLHALQVIHGTTGLSSPALPFYVSYVATTWLAIWLFTQGPIRVLHVRWRFEGGQVLTMEPGSRCGRMCGAIRHSRAHAEGHGEPAHGEPAHGEPEHGEPEHGEPDRHEHASALEQPAEHGRQDAPAVGQELVEGVTCQRGHFCHPALLYCTTCGAQLRVLGAERVLGIRPPTGILILDDGTTHVLDHDVVMKRSATSGAVTFDLVGKRLPAHVIATIRLLGWTPVACGAEEAVVVTLPGGYELPAAPGVPVPLLPGAELRVGGERIRFESPYPQDRDLHPAGQLTRYEIDVLQRVRAVM